MSEENGSDAPEALIREIKKGEIAGFDGVLMDEWATAELYTQVTICTETKELIQAQPFDFTGGVLLGASLVLSVLTIVAVVFFATPNKRLE